jgi:acetate kinase
MVREDGQVSDHRGAFEWFTQRLLGSAGALPNGAAEVRAVGHRVVHGGETFIAATEIDAAVIQAIEGMSRFAPLHNPPNLAGIHAAMRLFPDAKHVAVFDTAFHRTMPRAAYLYALPYHYYTKHGVRRYGFHGTSHECVAHRAAEMLGRPYGELNQITAHLGNGASIAAIRAGESIDTSMGMTPLEGLVMGTRSGDIDPGSLAYIGECEGIDLAGVEEVLNWESGLRGLSGISNDMRRLLDAAEAGDERAELALQVFAHRVRKYMGAYLAILGRVDDIVFTAGIGTNAAAMRARICDGLEPLGIVLDPERNRAVVGREGVISADGSQTAVLVVPTNEELSIARQTWQQVAGPMQEETA